MSGRGSARKRKATTPSEAAEPMSPVSTDDDYQLKRQRNNVAVCKTRQKKRQEEQETNEKVSKLKEENEVLERKVEAMKSELKLLKEMIVAVAPGSKQDERK